MDYRKRIYDSYVKTHWTHTHSQSIDEYELMAKVYKKRFREYLPENKDALIADVACGPGHFVYFLKELGYTKVVGTDLSEEQVAAAREFGLKEVEHGDLFDYLRDKKGKFDLLAANHIIEHLDKDETLEFLDTLYAALKPGGSLIIGTINTSSLMGAGALSVDFTHLQGFTPISLAQVLRVCGFEDIDIHGDEPVVHNFSSLCRASLWKVVKWFLKIYVTIERGSGRSLWKKHLCFEPSMFAVARKSK